MGIFTRNKIDKKTKLWLQSINKIQYGLKESRTSFFNRCIRALENDDSKHIKIRNRKLSSSIERAIIAYQLFQTAAVLSGKKYIPEDQGKGYADLLFEKVCGKDLDECLVYFRYFVDDPDESARNKRLSNAVAKYIANDIAAPLEFVAIASRAPVLITDIRLYLADAFNDEKELEIIGQEVKK